MALLFYLDNLPPFAIMKVGETCSDKRFNS